MKVLVDTCVWSYALRRGRLSAEQEPVVREFGHLIRDSRVQLIGPIRQEILSGMRDNAQYLVLRDHLREFPDLLVSTDDHERAAEMFNRLRAKGIQGSNTDVLLCSLSERTGMPIFTTDEDVRLVIKNLKLKLYHVRK